MSELLVADLMTTPTVTVFATDNLATANEIMTERSIRHLPVVTRQGELLGIISHRDLVREALFATNELPYSEEKRFLEQTLVERAMTIEPETVAPETPLVDAARMLLEQKFGCLPVVDGLEVVGILTEADFIKVVIRLCEEEPRTFSSLIAHP